MKIIVIALLAALTTGIVAAQDSEKARRSAEVQVKMRQVDLLLNIMPLAMKKAQYKELLTQLERVRAAQVTILTREDEEIVKLDKVLTDALAAAREKGVYPTRELLAECKKVTRGLALNRLIARDQLVDAYYETVAKTLDKGQQKIMANSLDWKAIDPGAKLDEKPEEDKVRFFIRVVFFDPLSYDLMKELERKASDD
jgi:hypothetical protein